MNMKMMNCSSGFLPIVHSNIVSVWIVFFIYAIFMARRQSKLRADIEALKKELAERKRKA